MQKVKSQIQRLSTIVHPTLIIGETGVGKELCARAIHTSNQQLDLSYQRMPPKLMEIMIDECQNLN